MHSASYKKIVLVILCISPIVELMAMKINKPPIQHTQLVKSTTPTPLHLAAKEGNIEKINRLLDAGTDINSTECDFNNTPLHIATWFGHAHCIPVLIKGGAQLTIPNNLGSLPTHIAAWQNEPGCLQELIKYGADCCTKNETGEGNTPLYLAAKAGSTECLILLLQQINNNKSHLELKCSGDNSTALQAAAGREHAQCYWNLIVAGADYTKKMYYKDSQHINSELVEDNNSLKKFIQAIEHYGKNNPPQFHIKNYDSCLLCTKKFQQNNVIVTINQCGQTFHTDCFDNYCVRYFIQKNITSSRIQELKKKESDKEIEHLMKTSPFGHISLADRCPTCNIAFNPQESLELSVFLP